MSTDVLSVIRALAARNLSIRLTKTYKGLILNQHVQIHGVYPDRAVFQAWDVGPLAAAEGSIHIHSPEFPLPASARRVDCNPGECTLTLSDFAYLENAWAERVRDRVQPPYPVHILLRARPRQFCGILEDIQAAGLGVTVDEPAVEALGIQPGSEVEMDIRIHPNWVWKSLPGTVEYAKPTGEKQMRLGIRTQPDRRQAYLLEKYITHRAQEILQELDRAYLRTIQLS